MLSGKLALVTGAGRGIGEAISLILLREGAKVAAVDINPIHPDKYAKFKDLCQVFKADISSKNEADQLIENVQSHFGFAAQCIVNCAGLIAIKPFFEITEKEFDEVIKVNLKGTYLISQAGAKSLIECQKKDSLVSGGSIVNISSMISSVGGAEGYAHYAASKAGMLGLTKTLSKELAPYNIRCNAVLPGLIVTQMSCATVPEKLRNDFREATALKRLGKPEEVGEVCAFLLSDKSSFVTGSFFEISGGIAI